TRGYPRHRVCGEFISGRGQETLARLGSLERVQAAGALSARTALFIPAEVEHAVSSVASNVRALPEAALCISRYELDTLLAEQFQKLGGKLRQNERWPEECFPEGVVRASGRRAQATQSGWRWFGLKIHARNVLLVADLEMYLLRDGYVGLCRLREG